MVALGNEGGFRAAGHERIEFLDELVAQTGVVGKVSEGERAVPGADFAVENGAGAVLVRAGDEVLGEGFADFLRGPALRPVAEVVLLRGLCDGGDGDGQQQCQN